MLFRLTHNFNGLWAREAEGLNFKEKNELARDITKANVTDQSMNEIMSGKRSVSAGIINNIIGYFRLGSHLIEPSPSSEQPQSTTLEAPDPPKIPAPSVRLYLSQSLPTQLNNEISTQNNHRHTKPDHLGRREQISTSTPRRAQNAENNNRKSQVQIKGVLMIRKQDSNGFVVPKSFCKRTCILRRRKIEEGFNSRQLANAVGISESALEAIEQGYAVEYDIAEEIAATLGSRISFLFVEQRGNLFVRQRRS
jgi:DNA-binding XRE family transcriptional regulator